jgi:hypothetical protein
MRTAILGAVEPDGHGAAPMDLSFFAGDANLGVYDLQSH